MTTGRRGFFAALLGSGPAVALANIPEPEDVRRIVRRLDGTSIDDTFVLTPSTHLSIKAMESIQKVWSMAFAGAPPKLLILEPGMKIERM